MFLPESGVSNKDALLAAGAVDYFTPTKEQMLGCIGCQWYQALELGEMPSFFVQQIKECANVSSSAISPLVAGLVEAQAIEELPPDPDKDYSDGRSRRRKLFSPANTTVGRLLVQGLGESDVCYRRREIADLHRLLGPGDTIALQDFDQLYLFEEMLAALIDRSTNQRMLDAWHDRVDIRQLLFPPKLTGYIGNCRLIVTDNPLTNLIDADKNGWHFRPGNPRLPYQIDNARFKESLSHFVFTGEIVRPDKDTVSTVQALLWYSNVPTSSTRRPYTLKDGSEGYTIQRNKWTAEFGGANIARYVTGISLLPDDYDAAEGGRQMTFAALQEELRLSY